jgi:hypothetical protein
VSAVGETDVSHPCYMRGWVEIHRAGRRPSVESTMRLEPRRPAMALSGAPYPRTDQGEVESATPSGHTSEMSLSLRAPREGLSAAAAVSKNGCEAPLLFGPRLQCLASMART